MKVRIITMLTCLTLLLAFGATAQDEPQQEAPAFPDERAEISYALGLQVGAQLDGPYKLDTDALADGIRDALGDGEPKLDEAGVMQAMGAFQARMEEARASRGDDLRQQAEEIMAANREDDEVQETDSGLQYKVIEAGEGASPTRESQVRVHYTGTFADGELFDSSVERGEPAVFPVGGVIPGWTEALTMMNEGAQWRIWVPGDLAYGPQGRGQIPPDTMLIFDVELLEVLDAAPEGFGIDLQ